MQLPRNVKRGIGLFVDIVSITTAMLIAYVLSFDAIVPLKWSQWMILGGVVLCATLFAFIRLGLYRAVVRYVGFKVLSLVFFTVVFSGALLVVGALLMGIALPVSAVVNYILIGLLLTGGSRLIVREGYQRAMSRKKDRVLIYGAGSAGRQLAQAINNGSEFHPVLFADDDPSLQNTSLLGLSVISPDYIDRYVREHDVQRILLALPSTPRSRRREILEALECLPVKVQTVPGMADMVNNEMSIDQLQDIRVEDLLGRDPVTPDARLMEKHITGQTVLVTGAGGSIGSELCRQILLQRPKVILLYELSEFALYSIERELIEMCLQHGIGAEVIPVIGTVQRRNRIETVLKSFNVDTVYHAAAYKHVPLVEYNMVEGVRNNVFGTWHTAEAAIAAGVKQFVLISTDKAVRPTNVMGTTKRLSELVLQALAQRQSDTRFCMVRFGNVLGSSGSVVPLFKEQIERGGPVTVTDPDITRFFMTIPEAAQLVIQAGTMGNSGSVFVLDMGESVKIIDLARKMIRLSGLEEKSETNPHGDIAIEFTGLRPGEKLYEELLIGDNVEASEHPRILRANEDALSWGSMKQLLDNLDDTCQRFAIDELRDVMLQAPTGYQPTDDRICDVIWNKHRTCEDKGDADVA
ncbi:MULTISPECIES: nucleoside-diphosphate sugar epimerase/dehydratase [Idiomarina]|jgi:FlaA1/EpsC-like NDP-sugar epimerase|uniref:nucleoside-diphosphate sugar epimerase/dehydratase n=1 Tax=Idiomarina TaxID=135575 RepID=UPI000C09A2A0|nr:MULTISPECIES: nucleoside-diphosphate sugar epimerase/dehydratase [Idiomarina]MAC34249.1 nucleoside-diphosphate sugar epimerase [Haliea sp.]MAO67407.1 nucleoside-diphosphate sugar epimerase [Idiomarina sp.]MBF80411.1 nucleoside-diphosphate sugar epimerase [Idiomarina sp.]MBP59177.1 nucleoside-diphosphate sugar epimerase [Idiomarina sp.]|tara:strand:- start:4644 stop:6551 length:1908 start_codon:yes stop_codon:yes gene_type:complete